MTTLENLVKVFQEEKVVERISKAEDVIRTFQSIQSSYSSELKDFKENLKEPINNGEIPSQQAVQVGVICMMAGLDDYQVYLHYEKLPKSLYQVEGELEKVARKMGRFLWAGGSFSEKRLVNLIIEFFT